MTANEEATNEKTNAIPASWAPVLRFALKNHGLAKNSSFNHMPEDVTNDAVERRNILDSMANAGYFTMSKPGQVYIYELTEKGRKAAAGAWQ